MIMKEIFKKIDWIDKYKFINYISGLFGGVYLAGLLIIIKGEKPIPGIMLFISGAILTVIFSFIADKIRSENTKSIIESKV